MLLQNLCVKCLRDLHVLGYIQMQIDPANCSQGRGQHEVSYFLIFFFLTREQLENVERFKCELLFVILELEGKK